MIANETTVVFVGQNDPIKVDVGRWRHIRKLAQTPTPYLGLKADAIVDPEIKTQTSGWTMLLGQTPTPYLGLNPGRYILMFEQATLQGGYF